MPDSTAPASFVAIGDSFTEGMGDHYADGSERGWADLVAASIASHREAPVDYANLAIRGRKLAPLLAEQLDPAIGMRPELLSINGGGNDMLRPTMRLADAGRLLVDAARRARDAGVRVLVLSGADPTQHLPLGTVAHTRGVALGELVREALAAEEGMSLCDNFGDARLRSPEHWSPDGLHLNTRGHARVAINVLGALDVPVPAALEALAETVVIPTDFRSAAYYRDHVLPWVGRRLRGRSSGDLRVAKRPALAAIAFDAAHPFDAAAS